MAYTLTNVINRVSTVLQDAGTATWGTAEIGQAVEEFLVELSMRSRPYIVRGTVTTSANSKTLDISTLTDLLFIDKIEFRLDSAGTGSLDPPRYRNWEEIDPSHIIMDIDWYPDASENVRVFYAQPHILGGAGTTSLDPREEQICINWVAGKVAINKANLISQQVSSAMANITSATTAINSMTAKILEAGTYTLEASTAQDLAPALILNAGTAVSNATAQLLLATAAMGSATPLINTKTLGEDPATKYMNAAATDMGVVSSYLNIAEGHLAEAARDESVAGGYISLANEDLAQASSYLRQSTGYLNIAASRINLAAANQPYRVWGIEKMGQADRDLRKIAKRKSRQKYSRDA